MAKRTVISSGAFTGLDQRAGSSAGISSLPHVLNFRVDESGALEKRNGYGLIGTVESGKPVSAVWHGEIGGNDLTLAACNYGIYGMTDKDLNFRLLGQTTANPRAFFSFGESVYCLGGSLFKCSSEGLEEVEGYTPLVATACTAAGEGTVYERPNILSNKRRVRFNGDGASITYLLPEKEITEIIWARVNGDELDKSKFVLISETNSIEFQEPPSEGINNVEVCYAVAVNHALKHVITGCRYGVVFESRLFVFGNPLYPDRLYHSELADGLPSPEYFTETGYHAFDKNINALIPCFNRLLIFFEDSACFTYAMLATDTLGAAYTSFPVYELHGSKGCILPGIGCAFENTPVTLCRDGLNKWVSTAIADERSAVLFSHRAFRFIEKALLHPESIFLYNRKATDELWFCSSLGVLIYNYRLDCFYVYGLYDISSVHEHGNDLWFGTEDGRVCLFTEDCYMDGDVPIRAELETPFCSFGAPYSIKSLSGMSVGFYGRHPVEARVCVKRGNLTEKREDAALINLPPLEEEGYRRVKNRLSLKRFFSCKIALSTESNFITVKDLHLFIKQSDGGLRIN